MATETTDYHISVSDGWTSVGEALTAITIKASDPVIWSIWISSTEPGVDDKGLVLKNCAGAPHTIADIFYRAYPTTTGTAYIRVLRGIGNINDKYHFGVIADTA